LPTSEFAEPGERKYPVSDKSHAANARARVSQFGSPAEKKAVFGKTAKFFKGKPKAKKSGSASYFGGGM
jgi:hypothetical protein